ncbi:MAG: acyl-ACP--UDP-N-acetylglucosamine O-acyltransferase [Gammaproteobacteria bacterium]|nr:acyl-ACP--UDP-N-acetylglucosamine O-acyltransferase [Gammaproteobacteria bacterium]
MSKVVIHPTALVDPGAQLADGVRVGPYAVIEDEVFIGPGTVIGPHAVVHGHARIGANNQIHAHAVIADTPQDYGFAGEDTWVEIGDDNRIREGVTIHRSTDVAVPTRVGSHCFLMAYAHVAHGCQVGDGAILTNNVMLGGHVEVGEGAILGGGTAVHQFCRVGPFTMIAGVAGVLKDILPYSMAKGAPALHYRLNTVGLRRAGVTGERYRSLETLFRALRMGREDGIDDDTPELGRMRSWLRAPSKRGLAGFVRRERERED